MGSKDNATTRKEMSQGRLLAINAAISVGLFIAGYYFIVLPQIDLANKSLTLGTPTEVILRVDPGSSSRLYCKLSVANIGEVPIVNVKTSQSLFLVTDSLIYTCGMENLGLFSFNDSSRAPREQLWPRFTLAPNTERRIHNWTDGLIINAFSPNNGSGSSDELTLKSDQAAIRKLFKGRYVLVVEYSYRRSTDFVMQVDTGYFWYELSWGPCDEVGGDIGGRRIIRRLELYISDGPENYIHVERDRYVATTFNLVDRSRYQVLAVYPRSVKVDSTKSSN